MRKNMNLNNSVGHWVRPPRLWTCRKGFAQKDYAKMSFPYHQLSLLSEPTFTQTQTVANVLHLSSTSFHAWSCAAFPTPANGVKPTQLFRVEATRPSSWTAAQSFPSRHRRDLEVSLRPRHAAHQQKLWAGAISQRGRSLPVVNSQQRYSQLVSLKTR